MGREHRIIAALGPTAVPVAPALGFCDDDDVNGAPFYVMGFVDGHVVRDAPRRATTLDADAAPPRRRVDRRHAGRRSTPSTSTPSASATSAARGLHRPPAEAVVRAVGRSRRPASCPPSTRSTTRSSARIPEQGPATIVHGDYRLDNCMVGGDGDVIAVLDWEICTLGDPLADVGLLHGLLDRAPATSTRPGAASATTRRRASSTAAELLERYAEASRPRPVASIDFYIAFGYWKLACILEGVYARYLGGALGREPSRASTSFELQVDGRRGAAEAASARRSDARCAALRRCTSRPDARLARAGGRARQAGSTPGRRRRALADAARAGLRRRARRDVRRRRAPRPPRPAADDAAASTASTPGSAWPGIELHGRRTTTTGHDVAARSSAPSPTAVAGASPTRSSTWPSSSARRWSSASAPTRRRCRTPGRRGCRSPRPSPELAERLGVPPRHRRRARPACRPRIERRCRRGRPARDRPLGAGAALRRRRCPTPGHRRAARRAAGKPPDSRRRPAIAAPGGERARGAARRARLAERGARRDAPPARGPSRRRDRAERGECDWRRSTRLISRPATTWRPSSSGTSANRGERQAVSRSAVSAVSSDPR